MIKQTTTILLVIFTMTSPIALWGSTANVIEPNSSIKHVTIYRQGAEVTRSATINLSIGQSTVILKGLSAQVNEKSIQVRLSNDARLESVFHRIDYLDQLTESEEVGLLEDQQAQLRDSIELLTSLKKVFTEEKNMILANRALGGTAGVQVSNLTQTATFFRERLTEIEMQLFEYNRNIKQKKYRLVDISKQLLSLNSANNKPTSQISLVVSSTSPTTCNIEINYVVPNAGWDPNYDIRVDDIDKPLNLIYKADVYQNTGIDWSDVRLRLSTGNPFVNNNKPDLPTYYLTFNNYYSLPTKRQEEAQPFKGNQLVGGVVKDSYGEPLIGANVIIPGTIIGTVTDFDGKYALHVPPGYNQLEVTYVGFEGQRKFVQNSIENFNLAEGMDLSEAVIISSGNLRGLRGMSAGVSQDGIKVKEIIPLAINKHQTSTQFDIEIPYSIPSDNERYKVTMIEHFIPSKYHYAAVPKITETAFLIATINDWIEYNLLDGPINLYFQGIYQGESQLNLSTVGDTLAISVGRDEDIVIKREIEKDYTQRKFIGLNKKESRGWITTIKNNKSVPIHIIVQDQHPVSKDNKIEIKVDEASDGQINETTGLVEWKLDIAPHASESKHLRYTVKSPRNQQMVVE